MKRIISLALAVMVAISLSGCYTKERIDGATPPPSASAVPPQATVGLATEKPTPPPETEPEESPKLSAEPSQEPEEKPSAEPSEEPEEKPSAKPSKKPVQEPKEEITAGQRNALEAARSYLRYAAFSYQGLIEQLEYEGYTKEEAKYGADHCGADWKEQAVKCAKSYLSFSTFSRQELIRQLEFEGFTHEQAVYGVEKNGY